MNPNYTEFKFPQIKAHPWHKVEENNLMLDCLFFILGLKPNVAFLFFYHQIFHKRMPAEAVDLVSRLLQYSPYLRSTAVSVVVALFEPTPFFRESFSSWHHYCVTFF
jgi:hypothetical protein